MKTKTKNNRGFIPLERINFTTARTRFKFKRGVVSYAGLVLVGVGVVTLPLPTGSPVLIGLGLMLVSPLKFKDSLRNKYEDLKHIINKRLVLWGVK